MARPRKRKVLGVWMNGLRVGRWSLEPTGEHVFAYAADWLARPEARPLSLSMPMRSNAPYRSAVVESWFDNLLPDSRAIRQRIQSRFRAASLQAFDLLEEIGRDCVGAVQLLPEDREPEDMRQIRGEPLSESAIAALLRTTTVAGAEDESSDFRISLAGAQEKTALLWHRGGWQRPLGATPSTHIFKLPMGRVGNFQGDLSTSVENEWLCSQLVAALGLPIAKTEIGKFEDQKALIVERFDRRPSADGSYWLRLPQEDLCQALDVPPALKYEADGGPGPVRIMDLLLGSQQAAEDRALFLKSLFVFWLLCATDGHAKNYSIAIEPEGRFRLTPLYDVISVWPLIGHGKNQLAVERAKMAMAAVSKNRHYHWIKIQTRHWQSTAAACGFAPEAMKRLIDQVLAEVEPAIDKVTTGLPADFPEHVAAAIFRGLRQAVRKLGG
ncbi:type II toxin-antitoxin system HipA family toxin [Pseudomarimonas arenosa]|uniref:Type II toxin-antitoxin system HipA family toxin n=1 Tax=Pseudomarimonas arenosa TaxID=2774145 RepID=A0AAW3ZMD2_9GAMM|nr:type II toxin-antitoxin system HipA family toxin [Pseudomarimonas arenosa]MBD8526898.1 type II toxin-antitoxin system HipA family toxin [Pseudomarimonas arenosa]